MFGSITSGFSVVQTISGLQVVNAGSPLDSLPIDRTATAATFNFAHDVVDFRVALTLGVTDTVALAPFAVLSLSDAVASETIILTYAGANGVFSGGGFTGSAGSYSFTGTPSQDQAALRALVFTPTANEVAPGQSVATTFSLAISSSGATRTDTSFSVTALSVNDAPVVTGAAGVAAAAGTGVRPFAGVAVADLDVDQTQTVTVSFTGAAGVLSGGGFAGSAGVYKVTAASAAEAQADLRDAVFTPAAGVTAATT